MSAAKLLTREELRDWAEWLSANKGFMLDIFAAVESLADEANAGMRMALHPEHHDDTRYDEIEGYRNRAHKALCKLREDEEVIRSRIFELGYGSGPIAESEAAR